MSIPICDYEKACEQCGKVVKGVYLKDGMYFCTGECMLAFDWENYKNVNKK